MLVENYVENDLEAARGAQNTRTRMNRGREKCYTPKLMEYKALPAIKECVSIKDKPF
jgi:hypothetical protein